MSTIRCSSKHAHEVRAAATVRAWTRFNDGHGPRCELLHAEVDHPGRRGRRVAPHPHGAGLAVEACGGRGRMSACRRNESRLYAETHRVVMATQVSILIKCVWETMHPYTSANCLRARETRPPSSQPAAKVPWMNNTQQCHHGQPRSRGRPRPECRARRT